MAKSRSIRTPAPTTDTRSPDERLEAFVREKYDDRAERMWARILDGLDAVPEPAPWISAARTLSERLIISEDAFFWMAEAFCECVVVRASETDPELRRAYDAQDEDAWQQRANTIVIAALRASGNTDVADLRESDPAKYESRLDKGGEELWSRKDEDEPQSS